MNIDEQKKLAKEVSEGKRKHLNMSDTFQFECTGCGKCCFNNDIIVNTYDLIRLRHGLKKTTQEILREDCLNFYIGPSSGLPIVSINFKKLNEGFTCCPFLVPALNLEEVMKRIGEIAKGDKVKMEQMLEDYKKDPSLFKKDLEGIKVDRWLCLVHNDRQIICRLYPCGRFQEVDKKKKEVKEHFIIQDDEESKKFCPGFNSKKSISLADYLATQDFWHSREGSAIFTQIVDLLVTSGFFVATNDNKKGSDKPLFQKDSKVMMFVGNLLYNFDSFNAFSHDPRVVKTIYDKDATQEDFIYVINKVFDVVKEFTSMMTKEKPDELAFQQFINSLTKGGEK
jgi:Fe-S-cluster containining protein